jgi:predicted transcriptional regulator
VAAHDVGLSKKQRLTELCCKTDARGGCGQAAMARQKRHSRVEVATKLARANNLARQGKLQSEIARTLGVSVMTLHRWRKEDEPNRRDDRIAGLQVEISRLRRLVADLLLVKLEEVAQRPKFSARRDEDGHPDKWPAVFSEKFRPAWISHHAAAKGSSSKSGRMATRTSLGRVLISAQIAAPLFPNCFYPIPVRQPS